MERPSTSKELTRRFPFNGSSTKHRKIMSNGFGIESNPSSQSDNEIIIDDDSYSESPPETERRAMLSVNRQLDEKTACLRRTLQSVLKTEQSKESLEKSIAAVSANFVLIDGENDNRKRKFARKPQRITDVKSTLNDFKMASGAGVVNEVRPVLSGHRKPTNSLGIPQPTRGDSGEFPFFGSVNPCNSSATSLRSEPSLKNFDENIISLIESEIMSIGTETGWSDVAGLEGAKKALREIVVLPFKRPDVFKGIRAPPKGVLLFGPPGTGKTMIGRCVASQCKATFFNISASSLTSKWVGEGEKLVRALFAVARVKLPSVIFIDEIDSILCSRSESEHESSRRIKTEFLVQLDGVATNSEERLLVLGATNRPQELDEAARRRFAKRLYIPLPSKNARVEIVKNLLTGASNSISDSDLDVISDITEGYSGADMRQLCTEAAMGPIRDVDNSLNLDIETVAADEIRPIKLSDFKAAALVVRKTVVDEDLHAYECWDKKFGCLL